MSDNGGAYSVAMKALSGRFARFHACATYMSAA